ncbi:Phage Tail Collar Domain protein [compost metagenome]
MATRIYKTPFAATGDKETLATADQPDGKVSLQAGWTPDYELPNDNANYRPVGRAEMNGILGEISEGLGEMQLNGFSKWQAIDGGWPLNAIVVQSGVVYISTSPNNTDTPGAPGASWRALFNFPSSGATPTNWNQVALLASPSFTGEPKAPTPSAGDSTTRVATTAFVQNAAQSVAVPAGFVLPFAASAPPAGWLRANGAAVSRTTYAALFAAIGTTYGAGDGSTTFNLPDVRAEFPRFWDDGRGIDANPSPRAIGSSQLGTAFVFDIGSNASVAVSRVLGLNGLQSRAAIGVDSSVVSDYNSAVGFYSTSSTASGGLPESAELNWGVMRPRNIALLGCIKY